MIDIIWIYALILLLVLFIGIFYKVRDIKVIRVFGLELMSLMLCSLFVIMIIGEIFLPIPQYYIKHDGNKEINLNEVLMEETISAGIEFTEGTFKILDSYAMHFNHLFLCSYEIDGKEEVRFYHLEKNIFGNMKPKYPLGKGFSIITGRDNRDAYYGSYVSDGIFAEYLVTVGYGDNSSNPINFKLNKYTISKNPQKSYFMWVDMAREPWKSDLVKFGLNIGLIFIVSGFLNKNKEPVKIYSKWRKGENIIICIKNAS